LLSFWPPVGTAASSKDRQAKPFIERGLSFEAGPARAPKRDWTERSRPHCGAGFSQAG
jgi:hypothetical protein